VIRASAAGISLLAALALAGRADQLVDVPTTRPTATVVKLDKSGRYLSDTVLLSDDPASGAGAVPSGFAGLLVLRCDVDYSTMITREGVERFTVVGPIPWACSS